MVSPPRQVVIDDDNTQIHYVGPGWFADQGSQDTVGNYGPTYKRTSHGTKGNDSLSFSFDGSSVAVWGTTNLKKVGTAFDPTWECFVDGISIGATKPFQFPENNWSLCEHGSLTGGPHIITINVTTLGNTFWFDYLTFTPSPGDSSATLLIQNTDLAILYDPSWRELGGTANMTTKSGSTMTFSFVGTSLTWVGFIPKELPRNASTASFSIDNGSSTRFNLKGLSPSITTTIYNQVFFTTPDLDIGRHTITVTYEGSNTPLTLDYLLVDDAPLSVTTNPTAAAGTIGPVGTVDTTVGATGTVGAASTVGTAGTVGAASTVGTASTVSTTSTVSTAGATVNTSSASVTGSPSIVSSVPTPSSTLHSSTPIASIVGAIVGGLMTVAILLSAVWWWRRRRALPIKSELGFVGIRNGPSHLRTARGQTQVTSYTTTPSMQRLQAEPFTLFHPSPNLHSKSDVSYAQRSVLPNSDSNNSSSDFSQSLLHTNTHTHTHTTSVYTSDASGDSIGFTGRICPGPKSRRLVSVITPVMHEDSGLRLTSPTQVNTIVEDVPPMYTTA